MVEENRALKEKEKQNDVYRAKIKMMCEVDPIVAFAFKYANISNGECKQLETIRILK